MILLADSGSTKTDWCLAENGKALKSIKTRGTNPFFQTEDEIAAEIEASLLPELPSNEIDDVFFYGAGCTAEKQPVLEAALRRHLNVKGRLEVASDMLAAARSICGHEAGIACILGTGSNSCLYDGEKLVKNVSPLGFILGDEGSGAVLGKLLVGDVLKNQLPKALCEKFLKEYNLDRMAIIQKVYKEPAANRFLASLSPFLIQNIEEPAIHRLVLNAFKAFFVRNIENYEGYKQLPVSFVGSVAHYYRDVLGEAAKALDITIGNIIKSPMEGLLKYHSK